MLLQASQKTRITRGAGQDDPGFVAPMNRPRFLTVSNFVEYPPWPYPSKASMDRKPGSAPWEHTTRS